ncbi:SRPBCC family protein [Marimonas arenosa]|uniref:SRPBCC family protein n=1 Tax=Marimonas arenosa TaxID=1795305 RepID=A0AAE4B3W7_9RHOB|nr:SRPBCC family protein [Marimonas arenosa]MDQ2089632.1 SRPBCC family protein [Marimonas arenosa]
MRIKRFFRRLVGLILLLIAAAVALAYLLPRQVDVSRAITINATPDEVFPLVNSLREAAKWSPWLALDPDVRLAWSGPDNGIGNRLDWRSDHPKVGSGTQIITESVAGKRVTTDLDFGQMGGAQADYTLEPAGTGTLITWHFTTDLGMNPLRRWLGLMMDRWVGTDFERGLADLKRMAEAN